MCKYPQKVVDRFYSNLYKTDTCWIWKGSKFVDGYGRMKIGRKITLRAHRLSWEIHHGKIPKDKMICHKCDVKLCVNPEHIYVGDIHTNARDRVERGRQSTTRGSKSGMSKLTERDVLNIRFLHKIKKYNQRQLAKKYSVSFGHINNVVLRKSWKQI